MGYFYSLIILQFLCYVKLNIKSLSAYQQFKSLYYYIIIKTRFSEITIKYYMKLLKFVYSLKLPLSRI